MSEEKQQPNEPSEPAAAGSNAGTATPAYLKLEPAHGQSDALPLKFVKAASGTITGPEQPTAGTITEGVGVLGYVAAGVFGGYGVGQSIADIPSGVAGAAIGGGAAIATMRIKPVREQAFKFVRWLENRD